MENAIISCPFCGAIIKGQHRCQETDKDELLRREGVQYNLSPRRIKEDRNSQDENRIKKDWSVTKLFKPKSFEERLKEKDEEGGYGTTD